jgi:GNAT superfamily N-acetyltransferase
MASTPHPADPASASAVAALESDPFYRAIAVDHREDPQSLRALLAAYFDYSIAEGRALGRCSHLSIAAAGVAVWLLPQPPRVQIDSAQEKHAFLQRLLGPRGRENYQQIVSHMKHNAQGLVSSSAWYLSIIAVDPRLQGRGLGQQLLAPTLADADECGAVCYLETFSPRNVGFYERSGFTTRGLFYEPTATSDYAVMVRGPASIPATSSSR